MWNCNSRVLAFWQEVGEYGVFDYEHMSPPLCKDEPRYHKAWMFVVGVYANGADISQKLLDNVRILADAWLKSNPVKCPN
jgi:hypothetical protein